MTYSAVTLEIANHSSVPILLDDENNQEIREDDQLMIEVAVADSDATVQIFFEDAEPQILTQYTDEKGLIVHRTASQRYFAECFGQACVQICITGSTYNRNYSILFDVRAKKISSASAEKMIRYLASHHENIIRACFSRSTHSIGNQKRKENFSDPEAIFSAAEAYISALLNHQTELMATKRTRLISIRQPLWKSSHTNCDIDPVEILNNLDAISPTHQGTGDLFLRGRYFSLGEIDVSALKESADVLENQVLLGGLFSIKNRLQNIFQQIAKPKFPEKSDGYESFNRLLLRLTSGAMEKRCQDIISRANELIRLFELRIGVRYVGEIPPSMTPYVRTSKIYRLLFLRLASWYELGSPSLEKYNFFMKLKSLSKLYELYVLFHLIEKMLVCDWISSPHQITLQDGDENLIPKKIVLKKDGLTASIFYEEKIRPLSTQTVGHFDLVDVAHQHPNGKYSYWHPDYIFKIESGKKNTKYLIFDAKYSQEKTVREKHLPTLVEKYYWGLAVYDAIRDCYSNDAIAGVVAIYPLGEMKSFLPYGKRASLDKEYVPLPIMGAMGLTIDNSSIFDESLSKLIDTVAKTL